MFMNHKNKHNKTFSPDLVCSTNAPLNFLPGKLLNWLQSRLNIEARIPQQASSKFMILYSAVYLCFLVLVFFFLDIFLTLFWHKLHLWDIQVRGLIFLWCEFGELGIGSTDSCFLIFWYILITFPLNIALLL